jgi:hypothetical protein
VPAAPTLTASQSIQDDIDTALESARAGKSSALAKMPNLARFPSLVSQFNQDYDSALTGFSSLGMDKGEDWSDAKAKTIDPVIAKWLNVDQQAKLRWDNMLKERSAKLTRRRSDYEALRNHASRVQSDIDKSTDKNLTANLTKSLGDINHAMSAALTDVKALETEPTDFSGQGQSTEPPSSAPAPSMTPAPKIFIGGRPDLSNVSEQQANAAWQSKFPTLAAPRFGGVSAAPAPAAPAAAPSSPAPSLAPPAALPFGQQAAPLPDATAAATLSPTPQLVNLSPLLQTQTQGAAPAPAMAPAAAKPGAASDLVAVTKPSGKNVAIRRSDLQDALSQGYKLQGQ